MGFKVFVLRTKLYSKVGETWVDFSLLCLLYCTETNT